MSSDRFKPLLDKDFLKSILHYEYLDYCTGDADHALRARLELWSSRELKRETQAERSFVQRFFVELWGYADDGTGAEQFELYPRFPIQGSGQGGNRGEADLAIGYFQSARAQIPQVICEFKGMNANLDAPQNRKGNRRSPVMQARDYLWHARRGLHAGAPVQPRFAIVTDMDEFRLYWSDSFPDHYLRFAITKKDLLNPETLLDQGNEAKFDRFLFSRLFRPDMLLADAGRPQIERIIEKQGKQARKLEDDFYEDYRAYRQVLIDNIIPQRADLPPEGLTRGGAVRLAQKLLDRLIFVMFAEDMGQRVGFPPNELETQLRRLSEDNLLEPNGFEAWSRIKLIFHRMDVGGRLGQTTIHNFNGGLFATDETLDALELPNRLFVRFGQGRNEATIAQHKDTLFYLAATYNYASEGDARNSIGLYTLGHIFEQSIVELEALEADADDRPSLTEITERKRNGVYYTPEWVVTRIVEEVLDPIFARWKRESLWPDEGEPDADAALAYWERLRTIKVVDPACGSGAFLIVALRHLRRELTLAAETAYALGAITQRGTISEHALTRHILRNNLFGVDINPSSVEITKLSLWLHTAQADEPLSSLDRTIQVGNSLVDTSFYTRDDLYSDEEKDRFQAFDWGGDFALGSFDAVIGNPPYVKLQHFKQPYPEIADWLQNAAHFRSTKTGNFDLYLPFIERGLQLLNAGGRMGYIAPNLWPTLEYGEGLRRLVHEGGHLEKWLDFRSFQVFEDVTVYTAIQIYTKSAQAGVRMAFARDGDISRIDWSDRDSFVPYSEITPAAEPWLIAPRPVRQMISRLEGEADRLDEFEGTDRIAVGVQATRNHIYHLRRVGRDQYLRTPEKPRGQPRPPAELVELEDRVLKPLIDADGARRFIQPSTETFLLFPYDVSAGQVSLIQSSDFQHRFPKAWAYLRRFESELREINNTADGEEDWYRYTYPKNLYIEGSPKVLVAQTVPELRLTFDEEGIFLTDNVRVNSILTREGFGFYILGMMNSLSMNYIFTWSGKPKANDFFEANKQFIAPLPIPNADRRSRQALSELARRLQTNHTARVRLKSGLIDRLTSVATTTWPMERVLPDVRSIEELEQHVPRSVPQADRKAWIDDRRALDEEASLDRIDGLIRADSAADVTDDGAGRIGFRIDEQEIARVFVDHNEVPLVVSQWRATALDFDPSGRSPAAKIVNRLRRIVLSAPPAVATQLLTLGEQLSELSGTIAADERTLHEITARLFNLSDEEERLVLAGR